MERLLLQSVLSWPTHVAELCHVQPWSAHSCCNPHSNPSLCQDAGACAVFPPSPQRACASKPAGCSAQAIIWFYTLLNWQGKWKRLQPSSKWMSSDEGFIKLESTDDKISHFLLFHFIFSSWTEKPRHTRQQGARCWKRHHGHKWCDSCCELRLAASG